MLALAAVACLRALLDLLRNARALHADVSDCRLVVCGIARDVSLTELSVAFERFGFLREVTKRRGFAFVEFTSASAASAALAALNGAELRDKRLLIKFAHRSDQVAITKLALDIRVKPGPHQAAQALRKGDASVPSDDASAAARGDDGVAIGKRRETGTRASQTTGRHILALLKLYRNPNPTHAPFLGASKHTQTHTNTPRARACSARTGVHALRHAVKQGGCAHTPTQQRAQIHACLQPAACLSCAHYPHDVMRTFGAVSFAPSFEQKS
jgi:hypothetical protein